MDLEASSNITVSSIFISGKVSPKRLYLSKINKIIAVESYKFLYLFQGFLLF